MRYLAGIALVMLALGAWAASPMWPGSEFTWGGPSKYCAAVGSGANLWDSCTTDANCGSGAPAGSCIATILQTDADQVYEEVEALEGWIPNSRTKAAATHIVTSDGAGSNGTCAQWASDGALEDSGEACQTSAGRTCIVVPSLDSADDNIPIFMADPDAGGTVELLTVWCHCRGTCSTAPEVTFADRAGNAIDITGGGNLTCGTGTGASTATTIDSSDTHRLIAAGSDAEFSTANTPTANTSVTVCVTFADS